MPVIDATSPPDGDETEGDAGGAGGVEEVEEEAEEESGCGMEEEEAEEEEEEPLPDDLVTMGQKVQEIKGESIKGEWLSSFFQSDGVIALASWYLVHLSDTPPLTCPDLCL